MNKQPKKPVPKPLAPVLSKLATKVQKVSGSNPKDKKKQFPAVNFLQTAQKTSDQSA